MRHWLVLFLLASALFGPAVPAWAGGDQKSVLVVYSTRRDTKLPTVGDLEIPRMLAERLPRKADYYSEHIDAARFPDPQYRTAFHEYLRLKYGGKRLDVVIAMHSVAFDFLAPRRDELFPGAPLVFVSDDPAPQRIPNSAGVIVERDYRRTLTLATALQPDTTQAFIVVGNSVRDDAIKAQARAQLASFDPRLTLNYLTDLTTDELEQRLASLPPHSIVYYLLFYQDAAGVNLNPLEYLGRISLIANRPVYTWVDSAMDFGTVGGSLVSIDAQIEIAAALAVRVLRGERADGIAMSSADVNVDQVDWRQLRRWNISEARVPAGTIVRFREVGLFERYRWYIVGASGLLIAQTALIAGLLVQRAQRRRAEKELRASRAELQASYQRIRDLGGRLIAAQEGERARIARELHDDISQQLTLLAIDVELLAHRGWSMPETQKLAREALERVCGALKGVHDMSHRLHPAKLRLIGLVGALASLQREVPSADVTVTFAHENLPQDIPPDQTLCLYRIAQEALQNAIKHSGARHVSMQLAGTPEGIRLTIVDDGAGFDVNAVADHGLGLVSMRERLEPFGGTLTIESAAGRGTRVGALVPFSAPPAASAVLQKPA